MTKRAGIVLVTVSLIAVGGAIYLVLSGGSVEIEIETSVWEVLTAVGTVGATIVAVWLAARAISDQRAAVARVVSAWVTDDYTGNTGSSSYLRTVIVRIANEGNEPVFNVHLNVIIGAGVSLGPLSAPAPIAVLPPRRELQFNISLALLAHASTFNPRAELTFYDPRGRQWLRDEQGRLKEITGKKARWRPLDIDDPLAQAQMGNPLDPLNPMAVTLRLLSLLRQEGPDFDLGALQTEVLAPEAASGWGAMDWDQFRHDLAAYQPTSMVSYPAQYLARVKLSGNQKLAGKQVKGESGMLLTDVMFVTLTFAPDRGWRVWGVGNAVEPHHIQYPPGTF